MDERPQNEPDVSGRVLTTRIAQGEDLTAAQLRRMEKRSRERRRLTPQALALRVQAVAQAYTRGDLTALCGELENLASACIAWARYIRSTRRL